MTTSEIIAAMKAALEELKHGLQFRSVKRASDILRVAIKQAEARSMGRGNQSLNLMLYAMV